MIPLERVLYCDLAVRHVLAGVVMGCGRLLISCDVMCESVRGPNLLDASSLSRASRSTVLVMVSRQICPSKRLGLKRIIGLYWALLGAASMITATGCNQGDKTADDDAGSTEMTLAEQPAKEQTTGSSSHSMDTESHDIPASAGDGGQDEQQSDTPDAASSETQSQMADAEVSEESPVRDAAAGNPADADVTANVDAGGLSSADASADAGDLLPDGGRRLSACDIECEEAGGVCVDESCVFDCGPGQCGAAIVCPPERDCQINCANGACSGDITCPEWGNCEVNCSGTASCSERVECGGNSEEECTINCDGERSCSGGLYGGSGRYTANCTADGACSGNIECNADVCSVNCSADNTCSGRTTCNAGRCGVNCDGDNSCSGVSCNAGNCNVRCNGNNSCDAVECHSGNANCPR